MTFPLWFSRGEQVLRYHGVKNNLFAREPDVPERLLTSSSAYKAYLLENVMPGRADAPPKSAARLLATEGFVSALFYKFVHAPAIRDGVRPDQFYAMFGITRAQVDPLDNAYVKVFAAVREGRYDAAAVVDAYARQFPEEADAARSVLREALLGQNVPQAPEIWLLNEGFTAGTTLFDQYRALPRPQTFDLNAVSAAELAAVPGVDRHLALAIQASAPFNEVEDLGSVPGMSAPVLNRFREMKRAMDAPPEPGRSEEDSLSINAIVMPYVWRAARVWIACALLGAILYGGVWRVAWWKLVLNGLGVALVGLVSGWSVDNGTGVMAIAVPFALFGLPALALSLWRYRSPRRARSVLAAWALAALPAAFAVMVF